MDRYGAPFIRGGQDLKAWLSWALEEERDASVVAVGAGADVDFGLVV